MKTWQMTILVISFGFLFLCNPLLAQSKNIYRCKHADGSTAYSNIVNRADIKTKRCVKLKLKPISRIPPPTKKQPARQRATNAVGASSSSTNQSSRQRILRAELGEEITKLEQAKNTLDVQQKIRNGNERNYVKYLERIAKYEEVVARHEQNIRLIKNELDRLK